MSESFSLDTPEQINAWVLLSRISQCHLHMDGLKVNGLLKWLKANVPDCADCHTVKAAYPRLLDYCDQFNLSAPGGERCNYQVLITVFSGLYLDYGVFRTLADIEANEQFSKAYREGRMVVLRTMDSVRDRDPKVQMVMDPTLDPSAR